MSNKKVELLIIDPQYDFIDVPEDFKSTTLNAVTNKTEKVEPALPVPGSWEDSLRLAKFIDKFGASINQIKVTLDTHQQYDIAHPLFWVDKKGNKPNPFTPISNKEIKDGVWRPVDESNLDYVLKYTETLESEGLYSLFIWPPHCLVGTDGYKVIQPIMNELMNWEKRYVGRVSYVSKGHNPFTEHYGGFKAEVPMDSDPTTLLNLRLIKAIESSDLVFLSGQALSHCVASTVRQLVENFGDENIKKLVLLVDTSSSVPSFEQHGEDFINEMKAKGMIIAKTTDITLDNNTFKFN
jgi:nicotinamidase-related amidase